MATYQNPVIAAYSARQKYDLSHYRPDFSLDRCAVIIETRPLPNLAWTLENVAYHTGWPIRVYCSRANEHIIDSLGFPVDKTRINDIQLPNYTYALIDAGFWLRLPETILIFQTDAFFLRSGLEEFIGYDYVGAPWAWSHENADMACFSSGGNGGLSLRKKSKMLEIIGKLPYERVYSDPVFRLEAGTGPPEDMYFAYGLSVLGGQVPALEDQKRFCVETMFHPAPLAVHGIDHHFDNEAIRKILFPELSAEE